MRISDWSSDVCSSDLVAVYDNYWKHTNGDGYVSIGSAGPGATYHFIPGFNCGVSAACDVDLANAEQKARGFRNIISTIPGFDQTTSEERREGKECVSPCRYRWSP